MNSEKVDTQLNLALDVSEADREKSIDLNVGYDKAFNEWELIVKYSGNILEIAEQLNMDVTMLLNQYAIIRIREDNIAKLEAFPQIEYIEKPKNLEFAEMEGIRASCFHRVRLPDYNLYGEGITIAVIDSGIDYSHPDFRNDDGTTRIVRLWDQTIQGNPPKGYLIGSEFTEEDINRALEQKDTIDRMRVVPSVDLSGHGTHVSSIASGNGRASGGSIVGAAPKASLLIVKLGNAKKGGFPRTTELMQAVDYAVRYALETGIPMAINLSFGNNYGSHDGRALVENYLDSVAGLARLCIAVGTGNDGAAGRHASGYLKNGVEEKVEFSVAPFEKGINIQIWKEYADEFNVYLTAPNGKMVGPFFLGTGAQSYSIDNTKILVYVGGPTPYNKAQEIYISFVPDDAYIGDGIWYFTLVPKLIVSGRYDFWLPVSGATSTATNFLRPSVDVSLTIPSTAVNVISVAAYDSIQNTLVGFSGRGYTREQYIKPDLAAPGVNINAAAPGGGYTIRSGTSMATPFVTGAAALLMEWGIVNGNDAYLYGEKVKAYLIKGAKRLSILKEYPNPILGYGVLCVYDSIPQ